MIIDYTNCVTFSLAKIQLGIYLYNTHLYVFENEFYLLVAIR